MQHINRNLRFTAARIAGLEFTGKEVAGIPLFEGRPSQFEFYHFLLGTKV
jgi:hypothetical protein